MNWTNTFLIAGTAQGLLLSVLILGLNIGNRRANAFLSAYVILNVIPLIMLGLVSANLAVYPPLFALYLFTVFKGPVLYLYVRALTEEHFRVDRKLLAHGLVFVPAILWLLWRLVAEEAGDLASARLLWDESRHPFIKFLASGLSIGYALMALRKLALYQQRLAQTVSRLQARSLSWLRYLIIFIVLERCLFLLKELLQLVGAVAIDPQFDIALALSLNLAVIYLITLGGLRQPTIFTPNLLKALAPEQPPAMSSPDDPVSDSRAKYQRSGLDDDQLNLLWDELQRFINENKPYINNDLTLAELAEQTGIKRHDLSQVINSRGGQNFYEFINDFRIAAARQLLLDPERGKLKMLDLAMEVGFNSQSTFYSHFKRRVGMAPRQYREKGGAGE